MQLDYETMEKKTRLSKMTAAKNELELNRLKLIMKADKLTEEIDLQNIAITNLEKEMISTEGVRNGEQH